MDIDMFLDNMMSNQSVSDVNSYEVSNFISPSCQFSANKSEVRQLQVLVNNSHSTIEMVRPILTPRTFQGNNNSFIQAQKQQMPSSFYRISSQQQIFQDGNTRSQTFTTLFEGKEFPTFNPTLQPKVVNEPNNLISNLIELINMEDEIEEKSEYIIEGCTPIADIPEDENTILPISQQKEVFSDDRINRTPEQENLTDRYSNQEPKEQVINTKVEIKKLKILVNSSQSNFGLIRPILSPQSQRTSTKQSQFMENNCPNSNSAQQLQSLTQLMKGRDFPSFTPIQLHSTGALQQKKVEKIQQIMDKETTIQVNNIELPVDKISQQNEFSDILVTTPQQQLLYHEDKTNIDPIGFSLSPQYIDPISPLSPYLEPVFESVKTSTNLAIIDAIPLALRNIKQQNAPSYYTSLLKQNAEEAEIQKLYEQIKFVNSRIQNLSEAVENFQFSPNNEENQQLSALQSNFIQFSRHVEDLKMQNQEWKTQLEGVKIASSEDKERESNYKRMYNRARLEMEEKEEQKSQILHDFHVNMRNKNKRILQLQSQLESNQ